MKKSFVSVAVMFALSASAAHATPAADVKFANGWDLESVQSQTNGIIINNSDRISQVNTDVAHINRENLLRDDAISKNASAIGKVAAQSGANAMLIGANVGAIQQLDKQTKLNSAGIQQNAAGVKAALAGVAGNGNAIIQLQQAQGNFATKPELATETQARTDGDKLLHSQLNAEAVSRMKHDQAQQKLIDANTAGVAANSAAIATKASQKDLDDTNAQVAANKTNITKVNDGLIVVGNKVNDEIKDRADADVALGKRIDTNDADNQQLHHLLNQEGINRIKTDNKLNDDIKAETADRQSADSKLKSEIDVNSKSISTETSRATSAEQSLDQRKMDKTTFNQRVAVVDSRFADTDARIAQQKADQQKVNKAVAGRLDNHEGRLSALESNTSKGFSQLKSEIQRNKKEADAGVAGVAAMANIPQVTESQTFAIGAGAGERNGQTAVAVGFSARVSSSVVTKMTVAADTNSGFTVGAGVSYGW